MRGRGTKLVCLAAVGWMALGAGLPCLLAESTNAPVAPVLTVLPPSPVQIFREFLVMTDAERAEQLSLRPEGLREPVEAKIKEYLAMPPEERELRLQATELRHYLLLLMPMPVTNRPALLAQIAEPMRTAVASRLETWNLFLPPMQEEMLQNEQMVRFFTQLGVADPARRRAMLAALPADQRAKTAADIARWQALPAETRNRVFAQFNQFFNLTPAEQHKTLASLSETERVAMSRTLEAFDGLTAEQRATCIRSFEKFANMSLAERQEFLKKAETWQRMSPTERERWRMLVEKVPELPPLPPGMIPQMEVTSPLSLLPVAVSNK